MNGSRVFSAVTVAIVFLTVDATAWARHSDGRNGLNFGASFQMNDGTQPGLTTGSPGTPAQSSGQTRVTEPYIGYAFTDFLSFGLNGTFSDYRGSTTLNSGGETITTNLTSSLTGGGLYTRLLFGQVMFLEMSSGYYERMTTMETQSVKTLGGGSFTGNREVAKMRAQGIGYRFGGGVELPIANGFYFTAGYFASYYNLTPTNVVGDVDKSRYSENNHEITFGIANYYN